MAALRIFARSFATILNSERTPSRVPTSPVVPAILQIQQRWSTYKSSPKYTKPENYTNYEITNDPNEWKYVERLLRYKTVPKPPTKDVELPSGYKVVSASPKDYPYFIERTRNHMQPVYLHTTYKGMRKMTVVRKIQGNIWQLQYDIRGYLKNKTGVNPVTRINEFASIITFKGDVVNRVKEWMNIKGF